MMSGCPVQILEALHLTFLDFLEGNDGTEIAHYLHNCVFNPYVSDWNAFLAQFEMQLERDRMCNNVHTMDRKRDMLIEAVRRGNQDGFFEKELDHARFNRVSYARFKQLVQERVNREHGEANRLSYSAVGNVEDDGEETVSYVAKHPGDPLACWKCGKEGHIARNCGKTVCVICGKAGHGPEKCFLNRKVYPDGPPFKKTSDDNESTAGKKRKQQSSSSNEEEKKGSIVGTEHWRRPQGSTAVDAKKKARVSFRDTTADGEDSRD